LRVRLGPDRVTLNLNVNGPYDPFDLEQIELSADFAPQEFFSAYERLFLDLLEGNTTLFVRADEAEEAWGSPSPYWRPGNRDWCRSWSTPPARAVQARRRSRRSSLAARAAEYRACERLIPLTSGSGIVFETRLRCLCPATTFSLRCNA
jgi:hypothetical protein